MPKPSIEIITSLNSSSSYLVRKFDNKGFLAPFHSHPEYELTYILEGKGKRFVGNNMCSFQDNDLVFLGSNLPHCWKLDPAKNTKASSIVIQFKFDFLGIGFLEIPEIANIQKFLQNSQRGFEFSGKTKEYVKESMLSILYEKSSFKKLIMLIEVLNRLSVSKDFVLLNNNLIFEQSENNLERINRVFAYIVENFRDNISLNEAAKTIGVTPSAFCKYFKKTTRKTLVETVTDFRINYATQQLIETDKTIADICFESGFKDMSHFYKTFTSRMEISPLNYRKQFLKEIAN